MAIVDPLQNRHPLTDRQKIVTGRTAQNIRRAALRQNHPQQAPRVIQTLATSVISLTELRPATPDTQ